MQRQLTVELVPHLWPSSTPVVWPHATAIGICYDRLTRYVLLDIYLH